MERKMIFDALHSTNGHQQKAAAKLGSRAGRLAAS